MCIYNIMKTEIYSSSTIKNLLNKQKIATLEELKAALQTEVSMTVYRKLQELAYMKSYSDRGKYYTLPGIPVFDRQGLWSALRILIVRPGMSFDGPHAGRPSRRGAAR